MIKNNIFLLLLIFLLSYRYSFCCYLDGKNRNLELAQRISFAGQDFDDFIYSPDMQYVLLWKRQFEKSDDSISDDFDDDLIMAQVVNEMIDMQLVNNPYKIDFKVFSVKKNKIICSWSVGISYLYNQGIFRLNSDNVIFSPDNRHLFIKGGLGCFQNYLIALETGKFICDETNDWFEFSPKGDFALLHKGNELWLYDLRVEKLLIFWSNAKGGFNAQGDCFCVNRGEKVSVYELQQNDTWKKIFSKKSRNRSYSFSDSGNLLIESRCYRHSLSSCVILREPLSLVEQIIAKMSYFSSYDVSPDGDYLFIRYKGNKAALIDTKNNIALELFGTEKVKFYDNKIVLYPVCKDAPLKFLSLKIFEDSFLKKKHQLDKMVIYSKKNGFVDSNETVLKDRYVLFQDQRWHLYCVDLDQEKIRKEKLCDNAGFCKILPKLGYVYINELKVLIDPSTPGELENKIVQKFPESKNIEWDKSERFFRYKNNSGEVKLADITMPGDQINEKVVAQSADKTKENFCFSKDRMRIHRLCDWKDKNNKYLEIFRIRKKKPKEKRFRKKLHGSSFIDIRILTQGQSS